MSKTNNESRFTRTSPIASMQDILIRAIQAERTIEDNSERYSSDEEAKLINKVKAICKNKSDSEP